MPYAEAFELLGVALQLKRVVGNLGGYVALNGVHWLIRR
jgi:hypothetical protein